MAQFSVGRAPMLGLIPGIFSVVSLALVLLVLLAGVNNILTSIYYLKTDASKLSVPSKLSNSTFLNAISSISSTDWVGQDTTASSLGIAETFTIHLLTACGRFSDGTVSCSKPSIGFAFNPGSNMRLDGTPLQETYSDDLIATLSRYSKLSGFLAGAYIASGALLILTLVANCISVTAAAVTSTLATIVLFSASIASAVIFGNVNKAFNANFESSAKLSSELGRRPVAISCLAFLLALVTAITLGISARYASRGGGARRGPIARSVGEKGSDSLLAADGADDPYAAPGGGKKGKKGFLATVVPMLPGQKHKYVQVEDQPALVRTNVEGRQRGLDEDWGAHDEYAQPGGGGNKSASASGPLVSMGGNKGTRDVNSGYEPYSSQTGPGH